MPARQDITTVAFIGTGVMGSAMALNLIKGGWRVHVYDNDPQLLKPLVEAGAGAACSPREAVRGADAVITMLPDSKIVRRVVEGTDGIAEAMRPDSLLIDMSTSAPDDVRHLGAELAKRGLRMLDAPVGRPPPNAREGTLLVMAGGDQDDIEQAWPLFECLGEIVRHVGPLGSGATLKIINNYMSMVGMVLAAEALTFGRKAGIDRDLLVEVLSATAAGRGQLLVNYPNKVLAGDISPDFPMRLGLKDIGLALDLGSSVSSPLALGGVSREFFNMALAQGRAEQDCTAMLLLLEDLAGLEPKV